MNWIVAFQARPSLPFLIANGDTFRLRSAAIEAIANQKPEIRIVSSPHRQVSYAS